MPHDDRYVRSEEFLTILKGLWTQQHFSFEGRYYQIDDITLTPPSIRKPHPTIYLGGESDMAQRLAAKLADVFIINGRPVEETKVLIDQVRAYAAEEGREVQFGISAFVICRDSMTAAQEEHARLHSLRCEDWIAGVDTKVVSLQTYGYAPGHVGTNGGTAAGTEGTPQQVADQFRAFQDIGVTTFLPPVSSHVGRDGALWGRCYAASVAGNGTLPSRLMNHENVGQVVDPDTPRFP